MCNKEAPPVNDGHLDVAGAVRDDAKASHLRGRASGRVDGDEGHHGLGRHVNACGRRGTMKGLSAGVE